MKYPRRMSACFGLTVALLVLGIGCGPKVAAGFDQFGYRNDATPYRVVMTRGQLMGSDWLIDNYYTQNGKLEPKTGNDYLITYELDVNDDGKSDVKHEAFLYDLRYAHKSHGAHIWLRTFPIPTKLRQMELRVLAQRYVDAVAGSGFEAVRVDNTTVIGATRRFAAKITERGPAKVAGQDAYLMKFDAVNVDQAAVASSSHTDRVACVLIRPPFDYGPIRFGATDVHYPALMLAGYSNLPEDFDKDLPAFEDLLGRIQIGQALGYTQVSRESLDSAGPAPNASPAENAPASASNGTAAQ